MSLAQQAESAEPAGRRRRGRRPSAARGKQRSPRREQVVDYLREAITVGRLADGERLIEERIATRAEDEPRPRARGAAAARARGPRRLVPVPRRGRARRLRGGDPGGADPDPPHARALQLHEGARADGRRRLRRAREGGLDDGRGARATGELLRLGRGRHPLPRVRALALGPAAHDAGLAQHRAAHPRLLLPLRPHRRPHADRGRARPAAAGGADARPRHRARGGRAAHHREDAAPAA